MDAVEKSKAMYALDYAKHIDLLGYPSTISMLIAASDQGILGVQELSAVLAAINRLIMLRRVKGDVIELTDGQKSIVGGDIPVPRTQTVMLRLADVAK